MAGDDGARELTVEQLECLGLFGGLDEGALSLLCQRLELREVATGEVLYRQGERGRDVYVVLHGALRLEREGPGGRPVLVGEVRAGEWVGEMSLLDVMPRPATVTATEPTRLLRLDNRTLDCIYRSDLKQYALLVMNLARQLSRKLRRAEERLGDIG